MCLALALLTPGGGRDVPAATGVCSPSGAPPLCLPCRAWLEALDERGAEGGVVREVQDLV